MDNRDNKINYPYDMEYKLIFKIKSGDEDDVRKLIPELADRLFENTGKSTLYELVLISENTIAAFKRLLLEVNYDKGHLSGSEPDTFKGLGKLLEKDEAKSWFITEITKIADLIMKNGNIKSRKIIEKVKLIVRERYIEDIR